MGDIQRDPSVFGMGWNAEVLSMPDSVVDRAEDAGVVEVAGLVEARHCRHLRLRQLEAAQVEVLREPRRRA